MYAAQTLTFPTEEYAEHPAVQYFIDENGGAVETMWHSKQISLLVEIGGQLMRERDITDYYIGGDQFIYYPEAIDKIIKDNSPGKSQDCKGPDFFYISSVDGNPYRKKWEVEEEGCYPDMIIEILSPSTARVDKGKKKDIYEQTFQTGEYYWYDHDTDAITGYRIFDNRYREIPLEKNNWIWCRSLRVFLGSWHGSWSDLDDNWLRFYDPKGRLIPTKEENAKAMAEQERREKEQVRREKEQERRAKEQAEVRADQERRAKDEAEARAEQERRAKDEAEAQVKRMEEELAALRALMSK